MLEQSVQKGIKSMRELLLPSSPLDIVLWVAAKAVLILA